MFLLKLRDGYLRKQTIGFLFLAWLITMPFGSKIGSVSLGFMTVYPNFIFTLLLVPTILFSFRKWDSLSKISTFFMAGWFVFATVMAIKNGKQSEALFDIRSLFMQLNFCIVLFGTFALLDRKEFFNKLIIGFRIFFGVVLLFGIFEFFTGIHFLGTITNQFIDMPIGNVFYAPTFIYDNPNDYLVYAIFLLTTLICIDKDLREKGFLVELFLVILLIFAQYADSNFAMMLLIAMILCSIILRFLKLREIEWKNLVPYFVGLALLVVLFFSNAVFIGPKYANSAQYRLNAIQFLVDKPGEYKIESAKKLLKKDAQIKLTNYLDSANTKSPEGSVNLRKNLILNGIDFIKEAPFFGIGPGGYRLKLRNHQNKYFINTHTSAHNFPIEIISEYGVFGWVYFFLIFYCFTKLIRLRKKMEKDGFIWMLLFFMLLPLLWMMPSSYLYLDINWLFLPVMICLFASFEIQNRPNADIE